MKCPACGEDIAEWKGEIYVCPKCDGEGKVDVAVPSPAIGGREPYRPDCPLCKGRGYIIHDKDLEVT